MEDMQIGFFFFQNWYLKGHGVGPRGKASPYNTLSSIHPRQFYMSMIHGIDSFILVFRLCCPRGVQLSPGGIFDGNFIIWPIENFSLLLGDAVNGRINSLEGPPICTGRYGYKLPCAFSPQELMVEIEDTLAFLLA